MLTPSELAELAETLWGEYDYGLLYEIQDDEWVVWNRIIEDGVKFPVLSYDGTGTRVPPYKCMFGASVFAYGDTPKEAIHRAALVYVRRKKGSAH